jgi:hypothetical protein
MTGTFGSLGHQARASLALTANTTLDPETVIDVVKTVAAAFRGTAADFIVGGTFAARVNVVKEGGDGRSLALTITNGGSTIVQCAFRAQAVPGVASTDLRVGGMASYRTRQTRVFGFIPAGPRQINAMAAYKRFLQQIGAVLTETDPRARISIAQSA